jgi:hypothetical protein
MRHKILCQCGAEMSVLDAGNADMGEWRKDSRGRWQKVRRPSQYRILARCKKGTCRGIRQLTGRNKTEVMRHLNREHQKARKEAA